MHFHRFSQIARSVDRLAPPLIKYVSDHFHKRCQDRIAGGGGDRSMKPDIVQQEGQRIVERRKAFGDRVLFAKYAGTEIKVEGEEILMMREEDILGVIEK